MEYQKLSNYLIQTKRNPSFYTAPHKRYPSQLHSGLLQPQGCVALVFSPNTDFHPASLELQKSVGKSCTWLSHSACSVGFTAGGNDVVSYSMLKRFVVLQRCRGLGIKTTSGTCRTIALRIHLFLTVAFWISDFLSALHGTCIYSSCTFDMQFARKFFCLYAMLFLEALVA